MTVDVKTQKYIAVNKAIIEEALKTLNIGEKVLARRSNAIWDIVLATEEAAKIMSRQLTHNQDIKTANGKCHEQQEDPDYFRWGAHVVHHGGSFGSHLLGLCFGGGNACLPDF